MISFLIPFRTDNLFREESFGFTWNVIKESWPDDEVIVADVPGEFNRAAARNLAASQATGDVFVFMDADSTVPAAQLQIAIDSARKYGWALPYDQYCSLTETGSKKYMAGDQLDRNDFAYIFPSAATPEPSVGGCVVVLREPFKRVRGYDERFVAWGEEDRAFVYSLNTLVGPGHYIPGNLYHLWHPAPEESRFEHPGFMDNRLLCNRYREAEGDPNIMLKLVDEHP